MMGMIHYFLTEVIFIIAFTSFVSSNDLQVNLDEFSGLNDICGDVVPLYPGNTSIVTATGRVRNGACGVMYRAVNTEKLKCKEICVTLKTERLKTCDVKIVFSAFVFSRFTKDQIKIFDCRNADVLKKEWCPKVDQLQVEVVESPDYALRWTDSKLYSFRAEISIHYEEVHQQDIDSYLHVEYNQKARDREYKNRVEGIVVAVCLAAIFLVLMAVMWCYYKQKATGRQPPEVAYVDFTGVQVKKKPFMKTIRSKFRMPSNRRRLSSVGVEPPNEDDRRSAGSPGMGTLSDFQDSDHVSMSGSTADREQRTKFLESEQI